MDFGSSVGRIQRMIIAEFSVTPIGKGESVSKYVALCIEIVKKSGLEYQLGPMGTCVEGSWGDVLEVITKCYKKLSKYCDRIAISIKLDCRKGPKRGLESKIKSVGKLLKEGL